jgi:hypothetical protein
MLINLWHPDMLPAYIVPEKVAHGYQMGEKWVISRFYCSVNEIFTLLRCYTV